MKPIIELDGVSMSYDKTTVVEDATLTVFEGDYLGIVGPSGAGKSTLLHLMAGSLKPTKGRIVRSPNLRVGYVPQLDRIDWNFPVTVLEVLCMSTDRKRLAPWPSIAARDRAHFVLENLGLDGLADRHIDDLSGGQQQRVFIGRALMNAPNVLLLDEPTSGVDVANRHDVLHVLHDLNHKEHVAIVLTTHDLNSIASHTHRLVCLNRRIIAEGAPRDVVKTSILEATYGATLEVLIHGGMPVVLETTTADDSAHHDHA